MYFNYQPRFNDVFSRDNLHRIKYDMHVIIFYDIQCIGKHLVSLLIDKNTTVYFNSFLIKCIPEETLNELKDKYTTNNIDYNLIISSVK